MKDIDIKIDEGKFKFRVSGIIIQDGNILLHKGKKFDGYCFPGGHVMLGETTSEAIVREVFEEIGIKTTINKLFCIHENLYTTNNKPSQEVNYYYVLNVEENISKEDFNITELDNGIEKVHEFCWINLEEIVDKNTQPIDIAKLLKNDNFQSNGLICCSDYREYEN